MKFEKPEAIDKPKKGKSEESEKKFPLPILIGALVGVVVLIVAAGFLTGTIQRLFHHEETTEEVISSDTINKNKNNNNTSLTRNAFGLSLEDTEAGVKMVCENVTAEDGTEQRVCRARTAEEKKAEEEEEKRKKEEEETKKKQEEELKEANKKKTSSTSPASDGETEDSAAKRQSTRNGVEVTAVTEISGCPEKIAVGDTATLTASVMPWNATDTEIFWLQSDYESIDLKQAENGIAEVTAKKANKANEFVVVSAVSSSNNKASKSCKIRVVSGLE